jgi:hypothetical protein
VRKPSDAGTSDGIEELKPKGSVMKIRWIATGLVFGVALSLLTGPVLSQEAKVGESENEKFMKAWQKYALPGKYHEKLEYLVGTWDMSTKIWMEGPDKPPHESTATTWCRMIFGGRFVQTEMKGMMTLEIDGQMMPIPVEAIGYIGYDNFKEKYIGIWIDSHSTGIYYSEGTVDETGKLFTYFMEMDEWETGRRGVPYKMTDKVIDNGKTIVSEFHDLTMPDGKTLMMQMTSKRKD